jgi:uncharacterized protein involved in oxidation of intracellular sulfur
VRNFRLGIRRGKGNRSSKTICDKKKKGSYMKLGIVIYSDDVETVWNAFRLGNFSLKQDDEVQVFLLAKGVACESIGNEKFDIAREMQAFLENGGKILACGTCLQIRDLQGSQMCPLSTMKDLYMIIKESEKVLTF